MTLIHRPPTRPPHVTPLSATIGAEIRGVDLAQPLVDDDGRRDPRDLLCSTRSCSSPASTSTPPQHIAFARASASSRRRTR